MQKPNPGWLQSIFKLRASIEVSSMGHQLKVGTKSFNYSGSLSASNLFDGWFDREKFCGMILRSAPLKGEAKRYLPGITGH